MAAIGLHAETIPGDASVLRWVVTEPLPATGRLTAAPGGFGELLADGTIARALVEREAIWTWLADGLDWAQWGTVVRDALTEALTTPNWTIEPADDELLALVARDVIGRALGGYIASHGGQISLVRAADGVVEVELQGTCAHCPAAGMTLHGRIETALQNRLGDQVTVQASGDCDDRPGRPAWWPKLLRR